MPDFTGVEELRAQLESLVARQIGEDGTLLLHCPAGPPACVKYGVPMEATYQDTDGGQVAILLHVKESFLSMLEILKYDGSPIKEPPNGPDIVLVPHS